MSCYKSAWILLSLLLLGCSQGDHTAETDDPTFATLEAYSPANKPSIAQSDAPIGVTSLRDANNRIAFEALASESYSYSRLNFVVSPPSALMVRGMEYAGHIDISTSIPETSIANSAAMDLPETFDAWRQTFNSETGAYRLDTRIWGQANYRFLRSYLDITTEKFGASLQAVDFLNLNPFVEPTFHSWLAAQGLNEHAIPEGLFTGIDSATRVIYGNALQVDAEFDTTSVTTEVISGLFEKPDGKQIYLPMLRRVATLPYHESETYKATELYLGANTVSLLVVVPTKGHFAAVEQSIADVITSFDQSAQPQKIDFALPLFEVKSRPVSDGTLYSAAFELLELFYKTCDADASCTSKLPWPNYENVNGSGYLEHDDASAKTILKFATGGIKASSVAVSELKASQDEPPSNFYGVIISADGGIGWIGSGISNCYLVYQQAGSTQASAFIFVVRDRLTKTVLYAGNIHEFEGEAAGSQVCSRDLVTFPESIWPVVAE